MKDKRKISPLLLANNIGSLMSRTLLRMKLELQRRFNENGYPLTTDHWGILQVLFKEDGLSQIELAKALAKDTPNITRMLDVMEKNGFIDRRPDPDDRRKHLIIKTNKAVKMKKELFLISSSAQDKIFNNISKNDLKKFKDMMERMYANLE
ncbi:MAG: MarR family transcriptional regulator [Deltaproteobacteria bacterium]|nr:MarR family transcriptional regulator [Deltaproteobacteria bacterium]